MSTFCQPYAQSCYLNCCNINGTCPTSSANCHYYYSNYVYYLPVGAIIGIVIGSIVFIVAFIAMCCWCCRRRRMLRLQRQARAAEVTVMMAPQAVTAYPVSYGYQGQQVYIHQPYNQVPYGQPLNGQPYGQPMNQPYGPQYNQPYNPIGQPINPMVQQPPTNQPMLAKQF